MNNGIARSTFLHPSAAHHARALQYSLKQNALNQLAAPFPSAAFFFTESLFPFPPERAKCAHESTHIHPHIHRRIRGGLPAILASGNRTPHCPPWPPALHRTPRHCNRLRVHSR